MGSTQIEEIILKVSIDGNTSIDQVSKFHTSFDKADSSATRLNKNLLKLGATILGLVGGIKAIGKASDTALNFTKVENGLNTVFKSSERVKQEWEFLSRIADTLGLDVLKLSEDYVKVAAAAKDTSLEGKGARDVLVAVSAASTALSLSADDASGALRAINQIMSKGKVQAEELRGQLGERIPGAFQIAARAMGVTTKELDKMLETGKLLSDDFIPKFTSQLKNEFASGALGAAQKEVAILNRITNEMNETWRQFGVVANSFLPLIADHLIPAITGAMEGLLSSTLDFSEDVLPELFTIASGVFTGLATLFQSLGEIFAFIGDGWSMLFEQVTSKENWIAQITGFLTVAAQAWPQLLVKPFLLAFKAISDGMSWLMNKITDMQNEITEVALGVQFQLGEITQDELDSAMDDIVKEEMNRGKESNFFDGLSESLQAELDEIDETIQDIADNAVETREENKREVTDFIGNLRDKIKNVFDKVDGVQRGKRDRGSRSEIAKSVLPELKGTAFEVGTSAASEFLQQSELDVERNDILAKISKSVEKNAKSNIIVKG